MNERKKIKNKNYNSFVIVYSLFLTLYELRSGSLEQHKTWRNAGLPTVPYIQWTANHSVPCILPL